MTRRSCLFAVCLLAALCALVGAGQDDPEALYRQREDLSAARRAATIWAAKADFEYDAAWKLSRISYWLGTHAPDPAAALERGVRAAEAATRLASDRPEGHFWLAANLGALAEASGPIEGVKSRGRIKRELERAVAIDPVWEEGSAEAALGQWYLEVPRVLGGSRSKAKDHLDHVLRLFPQNKTALTLLAQERVEAGHPDEARALLQRVLDAPGNPAWAPEDRELRRQAIDRLRALPDAGRRR